MGVSTVSNWFDRLVTLDMSQLNGGMSLGIIHSQHFYAMKADGSELKFPFPSENFSAFIEIARPVDKEILSGYATALADYGCVQAFCRGENSDIMSDIFDDLASEGALDGRGIPFTYMCFEENEPLAESIEYFVTPNDLVKVGLVLVIGGADDFSTVVDSFSAASINFTNAMSREDFAPVDAEPVLADA